MHEVKIVQITKITDAEGFETESESILATVRASREGRHGSEKWANLAAYSLATDLFRIRAIPGVTADCVLICGEERFEITSVENVRGRGMYLEILARKVEMRLG